MTGALLFDPPARPAAHSGAVRARRRRHRLVYIDPRRFGTGHLVHGGAPRATHTSRQRLGSSHSPRRSPPRYLRGEARGRIAPVKAFVLDQRRIAGVGNIYADEALFRAGIHPLRPGGPSRPRLNSSALREAIEDALTAGIDAKGASIDDFRHVDGARGSFQDLFLRPPRERGPVPELRDHDRARSLSAGAGHTSASDCQPQARGVRS